MLFRSVVHFCLVLLMAAVMTSPQHSATSLGASLVAVALIGLGYMVAVLVRMQRVKAYSPVAEDWIWHVALPLIAYVTIATCGSLILRGRFGPLYFVGAASLLILYIGIHNAWDTATWMAVHGRDSGNETTPSGGANS